MYFFQCHIALGRLIRSAGNIPLNRGYRRQNGHGQIFQLDAAFHNEFYTPAIHIFRTVPEKAYRNEHYPQS